MNRLAVFLGCFGLFALVACGGDDTPSSGGADAGPGGGGGGGGGGSADASTTPIGEPADRAGCDGASFYEVSDDPSARGPWAVGARTVQVGRLTKVEVWYPAAWDSEQGQAKVRYDIREALPPSQQDLIPDAENPWQECNCYRDLPIDDAHGPYPVVLFVHGTASFRTQSLKHMTHWASRGFVVVSAEHPGLMLGDSLSLLCPDQPSGRRDVTGDARAILTAVREQSGDLGFLAGKVDTSRMAAVGHSAGGGTVSALTNEEGMRVAMPWSAGAQISGGTSLESVLMISGMSDNVARYSGVQSAYQSSVSPKRLVGISNSGHLVVTDLCRLRNSEGKNILEVAQDNNICGTQLAGALFDCNPAFVDEQIAESITNFASTAVLEGVLQCSDAQDQLAGLQSRYPDVGEFLEQ